MVIGSPSETTERLFVIGIRGSPRVLARLPLPGEDVCRVAWPTARRLLLVLTRGPACTTVIESARVLVVDPLRGRVIAHRPLSGRATVVVTARTRDGLALLLAPPARLSGARLVLVGAAGTCTIPLPSLRALPRPLDKSVLRTAVGLAVDRENGRAYLVEPEGRVMAVNLASGRVSMHALPLRKPAAAAKGIVSTVVQARWLGRGLLAVTGVRRTPSDRLLPLGLRLTDTRNWRSRLVDAEATGIIYAGTTVLAFQPYFDQLRAGTTAIGVRGYTTGGAIRFRAFAGKPITFVGVQGHYAYAAGPEGSAHPIVDIRDGSIEPPDPKAISISPLELLAGTNP
jgi:hypothetical protein